MKKIIKLTENDLKRITMHVIKESLNEYNFDNDEYEGYVDYDEIEPGEYEGYVDYDEIEPDEYEGYTDDDESNNEYDDSYSIEKKMPKQSKSEQSKERANFNKAMSEYIKEYMDTEDIFNKKYWNLVEAFKPFGTSQIWDYYKHKIVDNGGNTVGINDIVNDIYQGFWAGYDKNHALHDESRRLKNSFFDIFPGILKSSLKNNENYTDGEIDFDKLGVSVSKLTVHPGFHLYLRNVFNEIMTKKDNPLRQLNNDEDGQIDINRNAIPDDDIKRPDELSLSQTKDIAKFVYNKINNNPKIGDSYKLYIRAWAEVYINNDGYTDDKLIYEKLKEISDGRINNANYRKIKERIRPIIIKIFNQYRDKLLESNRRKKSNLIINEVMRKIKGNIR